MRQCVLTLLTAQCYAKLVLWPPPETAHNKAVALRAQQSPQSSTAFDFSGLLSSLFGSSLFRDEGQRRSCLTALRQSGDPVSSIIINIAEKAISGTLDTCYARAPQQQFSTWFDVIPQLFSPQASASNNFGSLILGAIDRTCRISADREFCRVFKAEFESPQCNLCRLIALAFKPAQIKSCACQVVREIGPSQDGIVRSINACIGTAATSGILKDKFGIGGWIPVPGC